MRKSPLLPLQIFGASYAPSPLAVIAPCTSSVLPLSKVRRSDMPDEPRGIDTELAGRVVAVTNLKLMGNVGFVGTCLQLEI